MAHAAGPERRVEAAQPDVEAEAQLLTKRGVAAERRLGDIGEHRRTALAAQALQRRPFDDAPVGVFRRTRATPGQLPAAKPLRAPALFGRTNQIEANGRAGLQDRLALYVDRRNQEFRCLDR
jgi:hypothetical protein